MSHRVYASTGGYPQLEPVEAIEQLAHAGIQSIELSGGRPAADTVECIRKWSKRVSLNVHHYFPPRTDSLVVNLASPDPDVASRSVEHVMNGLRLARDLGAPSYCVHAGYLVDPLPAELGRPFASRPITPRPAALDRFVARVSSLADEAASAGVLLFVENNVLSVSNLQASGGNPLLCVDAEETAETMARVPESVRLLVDVGHLKVSARTLGRDALSELKILAPWIGAAHLSDNDGETDSNHAVAEDSWFWNSLPGNLAFHTVEVYRLTAAELARQIALTCRMLGRAETRRES